MQLGGWYRLWLVVGVLYAVPVIIITYNIFPRESEIYSDYKFDIIEKVKSIDDRLENLSEYEIQNTYDDIEDKQLINKLQRKYSEEIILMPDNTIIYDIPSGMIASDIYNKYEKNLLSEFEIVKNASTDPADNIRSLEEVQYGELDDIERKLQILRNNKEAFINTDSAKRLENIFGQINIKYNQRIKELPEKQKICLFQALMWWAIPMCTLYILGLMFVWVYKGFKKT